MATKTKPKGKKKGKQTKSAKRSRATPKRKISKAQSTRRPSNKGTSVTRTKKISRRPKKSTRNSRTVSHKEQPAGLESTQSSVGPTTRIYESQEVTAFGSTVDERDEDETITASTVSPFEGSDENSNDSNALLD
jgi:hypothetical protein